MFTILLAMPRGGPVMSSVRRANAHMALDCVRLIIGTEINIFDGQLFTESKPELMLKGIIKISSWISVALMLSAIPIGVAGYKIARWNLTLEQRVSKCDVCEGDEWFYIGIGLFALGGVSQLIPIGLGLIQRRLDVNEDNSEEEE